MTGAPGHPGVIPLTMQGLFECIARAGSSHTVYMQYVEIYNELIKDLLAPTDNNLDVREDPRKGTMVAGAENLVVTSRAMLEEHLREGNKYRTTMSTNCNATSSRSHAVLQLRLEADAGSVRASSRASKGAARVLVGKLSLIDLAGSERACKTDNRGMRLTEGKSDHPPSACAGQAPDAAGCCFTL